MADDSIKKKIVFFLPNLEGGGAERAMLDVIFALDRNKFDASLLVKNLTGHFLKDIPCGVEVKELKISNPICVFLKLIKYFKNISPDIFVSSFVYNNILSTVAKIVSFSKTKIVLIEHTPFSETLSEPKKNMRKLIDLATDRFLIGPVYGKAQAVVCVSEFIASQLVHSKNISQNKIIVIHNPISDKKIGQLTKEEPEEKWLFNANTPLILAVGRLIPAKDYATLLRAFSIVCQKTTAVLAILGQGEERSNLERLAQELEVANRVHFLGFKKNPYSYMARATVFVLSSKREGFPVSLIEAMACGALVVSTNCKSGPSEVIKNGQNGILAPVGNEKEIAKALIKAILNPFFARKVAKEGRERVKDFFIGDIIKKYEQLFKEI